MVVLVIVVVGVSTLHPLSRRNPLDYINIKARVKDNRALPLTGPGR